MTPWPTNYLNLVTTFGTADASWTDCQPAVEMRRDHFAHVYDATQLNSTQLDVELT